MLRHAVFVVFAYSLSGCSIPPHYLETQGLALVSGTVLPGGWLKVKVNDEIQRLAQFSVKDVTGDVLARVYSAKAQEVIGTCYQTLVSDEKW